MKRKSKICRVCNKRKCLVFFSKAKGNKDGLANRCKTCTNIVSAKHYLINKEKYKLRRKEWYAKNKDKFNAYSSEHYYKNIEHSKKIRRRYYREHKIEALVRKKKRELLIKKRIPTWANQKEILNIYRERERISKETGILHHVDHIVPLQGKNVCGFHVENNLRIIPAIENLSKQNKLLDFAT